MMPGLVRYIFEISPNVRPLIQKPFDYIILTPDFKVTFVMTSDCAKSLKPYL